MGGGDNAHIAALRAIAAHALEAALLQHPQQLDLHRQRHIADFIEEQGAAGGQLEAALARADRPRESAFFVPEQFGLQQLAGYGAAIYRHERTLSAPGAAVDTLRDNFFAGARFTQNQHRGLGRRNLGDEPADALYGGAAAHQMPRQLAAGFAQLPGADAHGVPYLALEGRPPGRPLPKVALMLGTDVVL